MFASSSPTLYNLGSGPRRLFDILEDATAFLGWREVRIDIDGSCLPDILADLTDLSNVVRNGAADIIYCSHVLEHFHDHEVPRVLGEFARILRPDGAAVIRLPDLSSVMRSLDDQDIERVLYHSPAGPIAALDVIYGHRRSIEAGNIHMAHRTGFTEISLARRLLAAGFEEIQTRLGASVEFCAIATRTPTPFEPQIDALLSLLRA